MPIGILDANNCGGDYEPVHVVPYTWWRNGGTRPYLCEQTTHQAANPGVHIGPNSAKGRAYRLPTRLAQHLKMFLVFWLRFHQAEFELAVCQSPPAGTPTRGPFPSTVLPA